MPPGPAACSKVSEGMISEETFSMAAGPDVVVRFTAIISTRGNRLLGLQGHFRSGRPGCESAWRLFTTDHSRGNDGWTSKTRRGEPAGSVPSWKAVSANSDGRPTITAIRDRAGVPYGLAD